METPSSPPRTPRQPRGNFGKPRRGRQEIERGRGRGQSGRGRESYRSANHADNEMSRRTTEAVDQIHQAAPAQSLFRPGALVEGVGGSAIEENDPEAEVCFICASPVVHNALSPCNHRTCHICALRLRALYKTKACAHCRTNAEFVIFTDNTSKKYEEFIEVDFSKIDDSLGVKYEKIDIFEDTVLLLRYNCPDPGCDIACYGWPDLHRHVKNVHHKIMCDLCTRNKKVFTHEHDLFTPNELRQHEKSGDDNPGAVDQSGFTGHPECGFCRQRFYGDDELYTHCRDKHERCHICDRRQAGRQQQYYLDYDALEVHFRNDHFLCLDQECLDKKFVVFQSEMDLKAHQLESHRDGLSKDARRDARLVDMSGFDYRTPHQEPRGGRREGRGRGRGRDPNVEALPQSSAQPMRRDELAFQRQLAIHSAQSISNRTFGGQLTTSDGPIKTPLTNKGSPAVTARHENSNTSTDVPSATDSLNLELNVTTNTQPRTPQEQARALHHIAITNRASKLLRHSSDQLSIFRNKVSAYTRSTLSAPALIDSFFLLFDCPANDLGTLIKELAEIFEIPSKRDDLLKAWNDWRAINEDYPSLPGPNGLPAGGTGIGNVSLGSGGKRILKLKSSTAQSSKSAVSRHGSWGSASTMSASTAGASAGGAKHGTAFPGLPASAAAKGPEPGATRAPPWIAPSSSSSSSSRPSTPRPLPAPSQSTSTRPVATGARPKPTGDAFPALPAAQKPGMNVTRPGYMGAPVKRDHHGDGSGAPASAWGKGAGAGIVNGGLAAAGAKGEDEAAGKGKGKKKQILFAWG